MAGLFVYGTCHANDNWQWASASEMTDQRGGGQGRAHIVNNSSISSSYRDLISMFGWGPSHKDHWDAGLHYCYHNKDSQDILNSNSPHNFVLSLSLSPPTPRNGGEWFYRLWSRVYSSQPSGWRIFSLALPNMLFTVTPPIMWSVIHSTNI